MTKFSSDKFSQLSRVWFFATPWTAAHQASLSITNSRSPPKPMSIELVMPSNYLFLCRPLLLLPSIFPSIRVLTMSQLFASGSQNIGVSVSTSVFPMNTQDWYPLGWTGRSPCSPRDSKESSPTSQFKNIHSSALSLLCGPKLHNFIFRKIIKRNKNKVAFPIESSYCPEHGNFSSF